MTSTVRRMLTVGPSHADLVPAVRIALSLAVPLVVLLFTDRIEWSLFASFGAFTSIYSRYTAPRVRLRQQGFMAVVLTTCVGVGALVAQLGADWSDAAHAWTTVAAGTLVAGTTSTLVMVRDLRPAGALFPVFATTAVASAPLSAPVWLAVLVAAASAAWCLLLSNLSRWAGEANRGATAEMSPPVFTRPEKRREFLRYSLAAAAGGSVATLTGIPSPYWAQVAAVVPLSVPGHRQQVERGLHRITGTAVGVLVAAFLLSFPSQAWQLIVWVVLMQFLAEMFILRNYSLALMFVTPLALLMVFLAHPQPVGPLLGARIAETAIGAAVGIAVVLGSAALRYSRRNTTEKTGDDRA